MRRHDLLQLGPDRLRVGTWRGDAGVAVLTPVPGQPPDPRAVDEAAALLGARGIGRVLTAAIPPAEQEPFLDRGFTVLEQLHLLRHDLDDLPAPSDLEHRLRRGWRRDYPAVLALDAVAFDPFWRFDRDALVDARGATPSSQFRVLEQSAVLGYAITGRAADLAYLQRLAVHPEAQGRGVGTALVLDGLRWAHSRRCAAALVNTQVDNGAALALYQRLGFHQEPEGLAVLQRVLDAARAPA